jgi:uncharacterized protein
MPCFRRLAVLILFCFVGAFFGFCHSVQADHRRDDRSSSARNETNLLLSQIPFSQKKDPASGAGAEGSKPFEAIKAAAERGDVAAQVDLGRMYLSGQGVPKNPAEAVRWYRQAAERGNAIAQFSLGSLYFNGQAVPQDFAEAAKWYRKAAEQGDAPAQCVLGDMYSEGKGVPKDDAEAANWYRKAAEQGYEEAKRKVGYPEPSARRALPEPIEPASAGGGQHLRTPEAIRAAAERGDAAAQVDLGRMYLSGQGMPKNPAEAVKWYRQAAERGNTIAQFSLGSLYFNGQGVPGDYAEAAKWYRKAAEQGDAPAQCILGDMYSEGKGVPKNDAEAAKWYRKAADQGYEEAKRKAVYPEPAPQKGLPAGVSRSASAPSPSPRPERTLITIVIPTFQESACVGCDLQVLGQMTEFLKSELRGSGNFEIVDVGGFMRNEYSSRQLSSDLDFAKLKQAGARYVIIGICDLTGSYLNNLDLRLWDVTKAKVVQKGEYNGPIRSYRGMIQDFLSEALYQISSRK